MKINVYTICKNEAKLAPFYADYWKALSDDVHVYVYDGMSDDGTREILAKYQFVTIIDSPQNQSLDVNFSKQLKNSVWKNSDCDFVMVCDFDETIFAKDVLTLRSELQYMKDCGYTILSPLSFDIVADYFPEYENGKYLHEICQYGQNNIKWYTKPILFNPNEIKEINYGMGSHYARPIGNVKWYYSPSLFLIHAKFVGVEYLRDRLTKRTLSDFNKNNHYLSGTDWLQSGKLESEFEIAKKQRFSWIQAISNPQTCYKTAHGEWGTPVKSWKDLDFGNYVSLN